jgi:DNA replication initiation complex subunit (GINS family)
MSLQITTEMLFTRLNEEKSKGELVPLQKEFYTAATEFVKTLEVGTENDPGQKQAENTRRLLENLKEKRRQKLLIYLAYEKPLPHPIPEEEEALYNKIRKILNRSEEKASVATVKITADIPEVFTSEGRKIGPYKQGEIVEVPNSGDIEFMVKNKIGEPTTQ